MFNKKIKDCLHDSLKTEGIIHTLNHSFRIQECNDCGKILDTYGEVESVHGKLTVSQMIMKECGEEIARTGGVNL